MSNSIVSRHFAVKLDLGPSSKRFSSGLPLIIIMLIFLFLRMQKDHTAYTTLNWGGEGIRKLTLDADEMD